MKILVLAILVILSTRASAQVIERVGDKIFAHWSDPSPRFVVSWSVDLVFWTEWCRIVFQDELWKPLTLTIELDGRDPARFWKLEPI